MFNLFKKKPKEIDWVSMLPPEMAQIFLQEIKSNSQACHATDEISNAVGPFGLSPSNPIPVYGIVSSEIYLGRLRNTTGERIRWRRVRSLHHENIEKAIDEYEIFDKNGVTISHIYISPYHWRTSLKPALGFKIVL